MQCAKHCEMRKKNNDVLNYANTGIENKVPQIVRRQAKRCTLCQFVVAEAKNETFSIHSINAFKWKIKFSNNYVQILAIRRHHTIIWAYRPTTPHNNVMQ